MKRHTAIAGAALLALLVAAVAKGPAAEQARVHGRLVDSYCYAVAGVKGDAHRQCAVDCVKKGIAAALVEKESGKLFVLLPEKDLAPLPDAVFEKMESEVTVSGRLYEQGGVRFLRVERVDEGG